jgi:hypothetical protein
MRPARFEIVSFEFDRVLIRDLGPWNEHATITNGAEGVVESMLPILKGRRLDYIDSGGQRCELLIKDGQFAGFGPPQDSRVP